MSKTFSERVADAIREILPTDTEFTVEADPVSWPGYIRVEHANGVHTHLQPWASDEAAPVADDVVQREIRDAAYQLLPKRYDTAWNRHRYREAHNAWVAQTGIEL